MTLARKSIILVGGGGHCKSVIDVIEKGDAYQIVGIIDTPERVGTHLYNYPIIGSDLDIENIVTTHKTFLITLGHIKSNTRRKTLFHLLKSKEAILPTVVSPLAHVSKYAIIGEGSVVFHNVIVNASASIGANCIINTSCIIEHDAIIGNNTHIAPGACINGGSIIEDDCFIGSHSTVIQGIRVGRGSLIAAGTVVKDHVEDHSFLAGNPGVKKKTNV